MNKNLILATDSYKQSHFKQYPEKMTYMHDYIESRGGMYGYTKFLFKLHNVLLLSCFYLSLINSSIFSYNLSSINFNLFSSVFVFSEL